MGYNQGKSGSYLLITSVVIMSRDEMMRTDVMEGTDFTFENET